LAEQIYQTKIKTPRIKVKNREIPTKKSKIKELSTIYPHAWIKICHKLSGIKLAIRSKNNLSSRSTI